MEATVTKKGYTFLQGGGEMGRLTRSHDWSQTSLGTPDEWPQSLRTTLGIVLHSAFPMFLFWGEDLICFYNDAFRPSLGAEGKHPSLGKKGIEVWPEIWDFIGPLINGVMTTGEPVWFEDQLVPFFRNGVMEDIYWTFSYSAAYGDDGSINGVFVTCTETTKTVNTLKQLEQSKDDLAFAIEAAELATWDFNPITNKFTADARYTEWFGLSAAEATDNTLSLSIIASEDRDRVVSTLVQSMDPVSNGRFDMEYTIRPANRPERILRAKGKTWFNSGRTAHRITGTLQDVTVQAQTRRKGEESEHQVRALLESAPFPIGVYIGRELRIRFLNQSIIDVWGKGSDLIGKLYSEVLPEVVEQNIIPQLHAVYDTGVPFHARNQQVDLFVNGKLRPYWFNYSFTPLFDASGKVYGIMNTAADVTDLNLAHRKIEESERNLRNTIIQAPVAMCLLKEPNHIIAVANERIIELWGAAGREVLGKSIFEAVPEVKGQGFEELLDHVYHTGETFKAFAVPLDVSRAGAIDTVYVDFVYEAYRDDDGSITGVMAVAIDVTEQVTARQKIEMAEEKVRMAVASAGLGTYEIDLDTDDIITSDRFNQIWGVDHTLPRADFVAAIHPDDQPARLEANQNAAKAGGLTYEARIIRPDGSQIWARVTGKIMSARKGQGSMIIGVVQDITEQKLFAEELSKQVRERTGELERKNIALERSNAQLEEFAHAASHDLKEPTRKIHILTDRLRSQLADKLSPDDQHLFDRVDLAGKRMSSLIEDMLVYSQVSEKPRDKELIDLDQKINKVLEDLELDIAEKGAQIKLGKLPVVPGHRRQLQQLFQNLLSNALKYSHADRVPEISITADVVTGTEAGLIPNQSYHLITVSDNGIGFEQKYAERIFQLFQRLHARTEYEGTGVGLSITRKVVENHDGKITAESEPGKGASFHVYLPLAEGQGSAKTY